MGPVKELKDRLEKANVRPRSVTANGSDANNEQPLKIGVIGFGPVGQLLTHRFCNKHHVSCLDDTDKVCAKCCVCVCVGGCFFSLMVALFVGTFFLKKTTKNRPKP